MAVATIAAEPREAPRGKPSDRLESIDLALVDIADNVRTSIDDDAIAELAASIASVGLLQPIKVQPAAGGRYRLVYGQRRVLAARKAGLRTIDAIVTRPQGDRVVHQLVENIQRADLNVIDEARALVALRDEQKLSQAEIAQRLGRSEAWVSNTIGLLQLAKPVQELVADGKLSGSHAKALGGLSVADQTTVAKRVVIDKLSSHQLENEIKWKRDAALQDEHRRKGTERWMPRTIAALEAAGVGKGTPVEVSGSTYNVNVADVAKAVVAAGWPKAEHAWGSYGPEPTCECQAFRIEIGGRKAEIKKVCLDRRHVDRETNNKHVADEAARHAREEQWRRVQEAVAPELVKLPAVVLRPVLYALDRAAGRYGAWDHIKSVPADKLAALLLDHFGSSWALNGIDVADLLAELPAKKGVPTPAQIEDGES